MNQVAISQAKLPFSSAFKGHEQAKSTCLDLEHRLLFADRMSWLLRACSAVAGKQPAYDPLQLLSSGVWELRRATPPTGLFACYFAKRRENPFFSREGASG